MKYLSTVNWNLWLLVTRREVSGPVPLDNEIHEAILLSENNLNQIQFIDSAPDMRQTQRPRWKWQSVPKEHSQQNFCSRDINRKY